MSRKREKKILKALKRQSMPKRIAGIKVPKALRRVANTELGAAVLAQVMVGAAGAALASPEARKLRQKAQKFAVLAAHALKDTAEGAADSVSGFFEHDDEPVKRKRKNGPAAVAH